MATIPHQRARTWTPSCRRTSSAWVRAPIPSPWLDVAHLEAHADEIDVLHLHSGDAHVAAVAVQCWAETVRRLGLPLVVTVHRAAAGAGRPGTPPRPVPRPPGGGPRDGRGGADPDPGRGGRDRRPVRPDGDRRRAPVRRRPRSRLSAPSAGSSASASAPPEPGVPDAGRWCGPCCPARSPAVAGCACSPTTSATSAGRSASWPPAASSSSSCHAAGRAGGAAAAAARRGAPRAAGDALAGPRGVPRRRHRSSSHRPAAGWPSSGRRWCPTAPTRAAGSTRCRSPAAVAAALTRPMPRPADRAWRAEQRAAVQAVHAAVYRAGGRRPPFGEGPRPPHPALVSSGRAAGRGRRRVVGRGGVEPPTSRFSGERSYRLSYLPRPVTSTGRRP